MSIFVRLFFSGCAIFSFAEATFASDVSNSAPRLIEPTGFPPAIERDAGQEKYDLKDWSGNRTVVVVAQGNGCPVMRQNYAAFLALEKKFAKDVTFVFVNGNPQDTIATVAPEAKNYGVEGRVGIDREQKWLKAFGLKTIGEAAVATLQTDGAWKVVYLGGINDRVNFDRALAKPKNEYLKEVLQDVVAGRPVKRSSGPTFGCSITFN